MGVPQKKWATTFPRVPGSPLKKHESKAATYRYIAEQRRMWADGALRSQHVNVKVDEDGSGYYDLYEKVDLSDGGDQ